MRYWDSSALVPLLVSEPRTADVQPLLKEDPAIATWWGTPVECLSALARAKREGDLNGEAFLTARERFDRIMAELDFVTPSRVLRDRALRLLNLHPLRAGDALQLASALRWSQDQTRGVGLVSLDSRLRDAATAEGFRVLP